MQNEWKKDSSLLEQGGMQPESDPGVVVDDPLSLEPSDLPPLLALGDVPAQRDGLLAHVRPEGRAQVLEDDLGTEESALAVALTLLGGGRLFDLDLCVVAADGGVVADGDVGLDPADRDLDPGVEEEGQLCGY